MPQNPRGLSFSTLFPTTLAQILSPKIDFAAACWFWSRDPVQNSCCGGYQLGLFSPTDSRQNQTLDIIYDHGSVGLINVPLMVCNGWDSLWSGCPYGASSTIGQFGLAEKGFWTFFVWHFNVGFWQRKSSRMGGYDPTPMRIIHFILPCNILQPMLRALLWKNGLAVDDCSSSLQFFVDVPWRRMIRGISSMGPLRQGSDRSIQRTQ